jgi:hypothetical protein
MTLRARLDRTGARVICGVIDCGKDLARVVEGKQVDYLFRKDEIVRRAVAFPPGWFPKGGTPLTPDEEALDIYSRARGIDGVWQLTKRNLRREHRAGSNPPHARTRPQQRRGFGPGLLVEGLVPWDLPVNAKCSACGFVQILDPDELRVSSHPSYRMSTVGKGGQLITTTKPTSLGEGVEWE